MARPTRQETVALENKEGQLGKLARMRLTLEMFLDDLQLAMDISTTNQQIFELTRKQLIASLGLAKEVQSWIAALPLEVCKK